MRLETFFEKFEQFADAPNAVAQMRRLLIHFAISGKLVPNDPREMPVALTLSGTPSDGVALPLNWRSGLVGDAFTFEYGDNLPAPKRSETGEYPVYGSNGIVGTHDTYLTKEPAIIVGRKGSAGALNIADGPSWTTDVAYFVRPPKDIDLRFTYYLFSTLRLDELGKGIKPGLSRKEAYALPIELPPLAEQKRIVAKVDELMALCDRLETQQQERDTRHAALARASLARFAEAPTPANLDFLFHQSYTITPADLRKSILILAVQGKLVIQNPDEMAANKSLAKVLRERSSQERSLRIKEPSPVIADDVHMPDLPCGWCYASPDQLTAFHKNALTIGPFGSSLLKSDYTTEGVPLVFVRDIRSEVFGGVETKYVSNSKAEELASHTVNSGDLLITKMGDPPGDTAIYPAGRPAAIITADCIKLTPHLDLVTADYLRFAIRAPQLIEQFAGITLGVAQQKVSLGRFRCIAVPLPPLAEQRRIVAKVDQLMALVDQLESQLAEAKAKSAALLKAVVHELLNPSAEVIDLASYRAAIGCYTIRKMSQQPYFGRTAAMKMLYLAEVHVGLNLGFQPEREAAGPLDHWLYRFEEEGKQKAWFKAVENTSNGKMKVEYQPGKTLAAQIAQAESLLAQKQRKEFDRLLDLLSSKKTEEVEIIATLFAAWNDFLIDGHVPTDDEIVTEVRENWHVRKERFTPTLLRQWLDWLRQNNLVPQGRLPHTVHQSKLSLN